MTHFLRSCWERVQAGEAKFEEARAARSAISKMARDSASTDREAWAEGKSKEISEPLANGVVYGSWACVRQLATRSNTARRSLPCCSTNVARS